MHVHKLPITSDPALHTSQQHSCFCSSPHAQRDVQLHRAVLQEHIAVAGQAHLDPGTRRRK